MGLAARSTLLVSSSMRPSSKEPQQPVAVVQRIADGIGRRAARRQLRQCRSEPGEQVLDERRLRACRSA
jgi:hypothetical protein